MKEFFQATGDAVVVNGDIFVRVLEIREDEVVLAVEAPEWIEVGTPELHMEMEDCAPLLPR